MGTGTLLTPHLHPLDHLPPSLLPLPTARAAPKTLLVRVSALASGSWKEGGGEEGLGL